MREFQDALHLQRTAIDDKRHREYNRGLHNGWDNPEVQDHLPSEIKVHKDLEQHYCSLQLKRKREWNK